MRDLLSSPIAPAAMEYAERGWHVFPSPPGRKAGYADLKQEITGTRWGCSSDPETVADRFASHPDANVCIATQESGIFVLDLDQKDGKDGVAWMSNQIANHGPLPETLEAHTPSGGWHVYFRSPGFDVKTCEGEIAPGVDVRGYGGMALAPPSIKPGSTRGYRWKNPPPMFEVADAPQWLLDLLPLQAARSSATGTDIVMFDRAGSAEVEEILSYIDPDANGYDVWCGVLMALHHHFDGGADGLEIADRWSSCGAKYRSGMVNRKWKSFAPGGGRTFASVCELARQNGADLSAIARRHRMAAGASSRRAPQAPAVKPDSGSATNRLDDLDLVRDAKERAVWNTANAVTILSEHPEWRGVLARDEFQARDLLLKPIPATRAVGFEPRELQDADLTSVLVWFNRNCFPHATRTVVTDAVPAVARQTIISPVRHYLERLTWDETGRLNRWLVEHCGADDTLFVREAGRRWMISAVARALRPGCKADGMLILEGAQGVGKSSAARILAGESWFGDALPDMGGKDAATYLRGKWIVEVAELVAVRRSEIEQVKAFLTRQEERFRPAYGRTEVFEPRRCVFIGTTNRSDYLRDETGNRRFWPVRVGDIDLQGIMHNRDQLWAEAVAAFRYGEDWWLSGAAEAEALAAQSERAEDDPWEAVISEYVVGRSEVACGEILEARLAIPAAEQTRADSQRVAGLLRRAGLERCGRFTSGANKGRVRYARILHAGR